MKKAVFICAHKDPKLLNVLISQLLHKSPQTDIYLHINKKEEHIKKDIMNHPNVFFIKNNVPVRWGNDSMMKAIYNSWDEIIKKNIDYEYFIMTTGQDLLVKPHLDEILNENKGKIWIEAKDGLGIRTEVLYSKFPDFICKDLDHKKRYNILRALRGACHRLSWKKLMPRKKLTPEIKKLKIYNSYNWSIFPYEVLLWMNEHLNSSKELKNLFLNTYLPEDYFLGTMIINSPYGERVKMESGKWSDSSTFHYPFITHPQILTMKDIKSIESSNRIFARKFDSNVDNEVIEYFKNKILTT